MHVKIKLYWSADGNGRIEVRAETDPRTTSWTCVYPVPLAPKNWHSRNPALLHAIIRAKNIAVRQLQRELGSVGCAL